MIMQKKKLVFIDKRSKEILEQYTRIIFDQKLKDK